MKTIVAVVVAVWAVRLAVRARVFAVSRDRMFSQVNEALVGR